MQAGTPFPAAITGVSFSGHQHQIKAFLLRDFDDFNDEFIWFGTTFGDVQDDILTNAAGNIK